MSLPVPQDAMQQKVKAHLGGRGFRGQPVYRLLLELPNGMEQIDDLIG